MRKSFWLSFVLGLQPFVTFLAILVSLLLRHIPIGKGFDIVSILVGVSPDSVVLLKGAG